MTTAGISDLLNGDAVLTVPGVWDGISARVVAGAGFRAMFSSGMAIAASLGMPDADIYTMSENLAAVRRIREATELPLIADIDHGYGGVLNVMRTVRLFENAGSSALIIEDQHSPKRCPACVDDPVLLVPLPEAVARIRAALDARATSRTLVVARTDASGADAMERAKAYADAGADLVYPVSKAFQNPREWEECRRLVGKPLLACLMPGSWIEREFDQATMRKIGVGMALIPFAGLYASIGVMRDVMNALQAGTPAADVSEQHLTHAEFREFVGFDDMMNVERNYTA